MVLQHVDVQELFLLLRHHDDVNDELLDVCDLQTVDVVLLVPVVPRTVVAVAVAVGRGSRLNCSSRSL